MTLFIDTHCSRNFSVGSLKNNHYKSLHGTDACAELIQYVEKLTQGTINQIVFIKGPGSLSGLRIGSAFAKGIALGMNIDILTISIWDILCNEYPDHDIFFHTGTKKWMHFCKTLTITEQLNCQGKWISNEPNKTGLDMTFNVEYPKLIELMPKYMHLASENTQLLYPVLGF